MSFFVAPKESVLDLVTERMAENPDYAPSYDAIAELREADRAGVTTNVKTASITDGFFRVASLRGSLENLAKVLDPDFLKEKHRFYAWLDRHSQHVTYDRRKNAVAKQLTFIDGKAVT